VNRWARTERRDNVEYLNVHVPEGIPAPRCDTCGEECRDLVMSMIGWDRPEGFDGFYFFHKGDCDRGWRRTLELSSLIESTEAHLGFIYNAMRMVEERAPLDADTRESVARAVGWVTLLANDALADEDLPDADDIPDWLRYARERQWPDQ
jgi:hypothetical protein